MPSPIIARADALMHRRRQTDNEFDDVPVLTDSIDQVEDIPILTEIESMQENAILPEATVTNPAEAIAEIPPQAIPEGPLTIDPTLHDQLVYELSSRIEERIKSVLPEIISSTIRDFLAEQEQIANS